MADNQKYYYMRLKENFFDTNEMKVLESLPDGYKYSNILLKLYLMSLRDNGRLMLNARIPYNSQMIATITRHSVGDVEKALQIFKDLGLIEILDTGAIYMLDIQNFIGKSSSEADRKKDYRKRIDAEKNNVRQIEDKCPDERTPKIEIDIDTDIEIEKEIDIDKEKKKKKTISLSSIIDGYTDNEKLREALNAFVETRKKVKKPLTEYSLKLALSKLDKLAIDDFVKEEIVNQSVEHGWLTFYQIKQEIKQKGNDSNNWSFMDY